MTILLLGSGGREHALAWKMLQSSKCESLFVAPGNAGTAQIATNVDVDILDFQSIKTFVLNNNVNMVVVGPEDPLVHGIFDFSKTTLNCKLFQLLDLLKQVRNWKEVKNLPNNF